MARFGCPISETGLASEFRVPGHQALWIGFDRLGLLLSLNEFNGAGGFYGSGSKNGFPFGWRTNSESLFLVFASFPIIAAVRLGLRPGCGCGFFCGSILFELALFIAIEITLFCVSCVFGCGFFGKRNLVPAFSNSENQGPLA